LLIKNIDKILFIYDTRYNSLILHYGDGIEKLCIYINPEIYSDASDKNCLDAPNQKCSQKCSQKGEQKVDAPNPTLNTCSLDEIKLSTCSQSGEISLDEIKEKLKNTKKKIDVLQKIIDNHNNEITKLNEEMDELSELFDINSILFKHDCGIKINSRDQFRLLLNGSISSDSFMAEATTSDIVKLIKKNGVELKKLIMDKKFNINAKNKKEETLLEIVLEDGDENDEFAIFLLENDIDISPSVENDVKISGSTDLDEAYFNNAKRNNHIDLLVKYKSGIADYRLNELVKKHIKSNPTICTQKKSSKK
jgi:hypothetical protein